MGTFWTNVIFDEMSQRLIQVYNHKNSAEVNIAPASGKISKNIKYRSRSAGQGACLKGISRTITMQGFTAITDAEKTKL